MINTNTDTVTTTIALGYVPGFVAVTPDGSTVYVGNSLTVTNNPTASVSVVNLTNYTVSAITIPVGRSPGTGQSRPAEPTRPSSTSSPTRGRHRVGDRHRHQHRHRHHPVGVGIPATTVIGVAVSPDGTRVYVANATTATRCR